MGNPRSVTYTELKNRLSDFLQISDGGNVDNIGLDLLNRAQQALWAHCEWEWLRKSATLSVDTVTFLATLPADFGRLICVGWDTTGDGIFEGYFDGVGGDDPTRFCELRDTFDKSTGHSMDLYFGRVPTWTPVVKYIALLDDFAEVDSQNQPIVEYSFFPADLILRQAQVIHLEEHGSRENEYQACAESLMQALTKFEQEQNRGGAQDLAVRDAFGQRVYQSFVAMDGSGRSGGITNRGFSNDTRFVGA